jgi:hypothetical protein
LPVPLIAELVSLLLDFVEVGVVLAQPPSIDVTKVSETAMIPAFFKKLFIADGKEAEHAKKSKHLKFL